MDFRTRELLRDMLAFAAQATAALGERSTADLANDPDRASAVLWPLTLVGEASSQLPDDFREAHPHIAFNAAKLARNRLIHGYRTINLDIVRAAIIDSLPPLTAAIERLLAEESSHET